MEATLVSPAYIEIMLMSPVGTFQCECCHTQNVDFAEEEGVVHVHNDKCLICKDCYSKRAADQEQASTVKKIYMKFDENLDIFLNSVHNFQLIEIVDTRYENFNEHMETYRDIAQKVAVVHNMTYLDGKSITDVRSELLAKRVVRKLKKMVNIRRKLMLFRVLYSEMSDINAAFELAKQHATCLSV